MNKIVRMSLLGMLLFPFALGCGESAKPRPEPVEFQGKVTHADGSPASKLMISLLPNEEGGRLMPVGFIISDSGTLTDHSGKSPKAIPGAYRGYIAPAPAKSKADESAINAAMKKVPEKYKQEGMPVIDVQISSGSSVEIKLD